MLRASSLGHCLPSPTNVIFQTCHRVCLQRLSLTAATSNSSTTPNVKTNGGRQHGKTEASRSPSVSKESKTALNSATIAFPSTREAANEVLRHFMLQQDIDALLAENVLCLEQDGSRTITNPPPFASGRPWSRNIKPVAFSALKSYLRNIADDIENERRKHVEIVKSGDVVPEEAKLPSLFLPSIIKRHLLTLGNTQDVEDGWRSYVAILDLITRIPSVHRHLSHIPFAHLHRLTRLLAGNQPKTHRQYLRLLAVLTYIKHCGGTIMFHQYNALIDHAGKGWRKTRAEEIRHANHVARESEFGRLPALAEEAYDFENEVCPGLNPDIYTYTTLLATAARGASAKELGNTAFLMKKAGLPPNRITHLALLLYFTQKRYLYGVRSTLQKMRYQNLELGLDGLNACMWAYGRNNRIDVAWRIYRLLRHNVLPETYVGEGDVNELASLLAGEYIFIEPNIRPNEVTFATFIQLMAYLGHFQNVLDVFHDMLNFLNMELGAPLVVGDNGERHPTTYQPTVAVYRSIFMGFSKHGGDRGISDKKGWTLKNLTTLFDLFLQLRSDSTISIAQVDFIIKAFLVTSGKDLQLMRKVWISFEERFGPIAMKPTSTSRLMRMKRKLFPEQFDGNSTPS